jgi:nucleotide-binding universal stress UspA family protein
MGISTAELAAEHHEIEVALDALVAEPIDLDAVLKVMSLCARHYEREEEFLASLHPMSAGKLKGQHEEALEIAARLAESLDTPDASYLARRFVAIVQHNIIEEERDVFPLEHCPYP